MTIDPDYIRQNLEKMIKFTRELSAWTIARGAEVDREQRIWFEGFEREYASKVTAEAEALRKAKAKAEALALLTPEQREALGL